MNSVAAAPGVFYVFRDDQARAAFPASRFSRQIATPRLARSAELFKAHEALLQPLMTFVSERRRIPADDELPNLAEIQEVIGSIRKAFRIVIRATDAAQWDQIAEQRALDLLIYLALSRFDTRPPYGQLPQELQRDVRGFFSTYKQGARTQTSSSLRFGTRKSSNRPVKSQSLASSHSERSMSMRARSMRSRPCCGSMKAARADTLGGSTARTL